MLELIYNDDTMLAVDKPTGLLSVPGRGPDKQDCLYSRVLDAFPDALMVHRLDMETSGLILFARTPEAQRNLSMQFEKRETEKQYVAVVEGMVERDEGMVDYPMRKDMTQRLPPRHLVDCVRGKKAITEWRVIERGSDTTRMALYPKTGRSHQLRVHMQSIGHPIVGDRIYGHPAERLMLHAEMLAFVHPETGDPIRLECPAPF
ncbi:MAG: RluA family pseudouridine synthase [Pontiellaceae bacterium]|nr:RluA family pseudouridine synthase [Pontiellaceae bacterium]MBN2786110.1 RluA family pseudouridine synthase [Pontiellaceae bacterium]